MALFTRFGLGHLLCKLSLEKETGIPAAQLILSLCLFRIAKESIHSMYKKSYFSMERNSRVFDHVQGKCVLGYKFLVCAFFDGKSTLPIDLSLHCEKGKKKDFGLTSKQRKQRFSKKRKAESPNAIHLNESTESKIKVAVEMILPLFLRKKAMGNKRLNGILAANGLKMVLAAKIVNRILAANGIFCIFAAKIIKLKR